MVYHQSAGQIAAAGAGQSTWKSAAAGAGQSTRKIACYGVHVASLLGV